MPQGTVNGHSAATKEDEELTDTPNHSRRDKWSYAEPKSSALEKLKSSQRQPISDYPLERWKLDLGRAAASFTLIFISTARLIFMVDDTIQSYPSTLVEGVNRPTQKDRTNKLRSVLDDATNYMSMRLQSGRVTGHRRLLRGVGTNLIAMIGTGDDGVFASRYFSKVFVRAVHELDTIYQEILANILIDGLIPEFHTMAMERVEMGGLIVPLFLKLILRTARAEGYDDVARVITGAMTPELMRILDESTGDDAQEVFKERVQKIYKF
jgi:hypothetical protein